jgi:23S rRNA (adenine2503-C2)-methyltransferase
MTAEAGQTPSAGAQLDFFGLTPPEFDAAVAGWGWPRFRGKQVRDWVYAKLVADPVLMTNLSPRDREMLRERVNFATADVAREQLSADGTLKLLLTWNDPGAAAPGATPPRLGSAETVMIPDGDRRTACVSSQVGCPVGCHFCASGIGGVKGNLSAAQIVEQVYRLNVRMKDEGGRMNERPNAGGEGRKRRDGSSSSFILQPSSLVSNVVFMGMGEPLANYANVMQAVRVLHDPQCFNLGARRITISTVGVPSRMRDLAREDLPLNLAISLHAPNEPLRRQLIPWAEHFALGDILDAARYYFDRTGREITLEYILLSGVNDRPEHARDLAKLCKTLRANVNLIRYNEVAGLPYQRPKSEDVVTFQSILRNNGVNAHVRKSRGRDIDAACGQLRRKQEQGAREQPLVTLGAGPGGE